MGSFSITYDIINSIDTLQVEAVNTHKADLEEENPIIALITPEWYYSTCQEILTDTPINWTSISSFFNKEFSQKIEDFDTEIYDDEFEGTFSFWYQSYHYLPRQSWGIHLRYDSLMRMAKKFREHNRMLNSQDTNSVKASFFYFFTHGLYHYIFENAVSIIELLLRNPILYKKYLSTIYQQSFNSSECMEELLADKYLFDRSENYRLDKPYIYKVLTSQGRRHQDILKHNDLQFLKANRGLLYQVLYGAKDVIPSEPLEQIMNILEPQRLSGHKIPIWLHYSPRELYS